MLNSDIWNPSLHVFSCSSMFYAFWYFFNIQLFLRLMKMHWKCSFGFDQISQRVFELMRSEYFGDASVSAGLVISGPDASKVYPLKENNRDTDCFLDKANRGNHLVPEIDGRSKSKPFELYKRRTTVIVKRKTFLDVVCEALAEYKYVSPNQRADLVLACR